LRLPRKSSHCELVNRLTQKPWNALPAFWGFFYFFFSSGQKTGLARSLQVSPSRVSPILIETGFLEFPRKI
jgi:hypothetical protein